MRIVDHCTINPDSVNLVELAGQIVRCNGDYYMLIIVDSKYSLLNVKTGYGNILSIGTMKNYLAEATLMPNATMTIGDPQ